MLKYIICDLASIIGLHPWYSFKVVTSQIFAIPAYRMYQIKSCFVNEISITSLHFQVQKSKLRNFFSMCSFKRTN